SLAQELNVQLSFASEEKNLNILADKVQLGVAVDALIINALEATGGGGNVWVHVDVVDAGTQSLAEITVRDDGPGISEHVRQHMFDPFFSGREAGRGLGFGLPKCWRIVTDHGGLLDVSPPNSGGLKISIRLPLAASNSAR